MHEQSLFIEALEKEDPGERTAFLDRACADDPGLRERLERLLARHARFAPGSELPSTPAAIAGLDGTAEHTDPVIGPYKLLEQIGEGGFGVVYAAEQTQPVRRKVALKILKPGMDSQQVVARFEAERQALALMDHPNIAKIFDGGATDSGRPYFVMELVKGVPITEFCDDERLTPRRRLELFVSVCEAVQHAHLKGIIHRDIKPSNVLVAVHDTTPVVKVIDFGIVKALGQGLTEKTLVTGFAQMIGTPLYMSPEQAGQSGLDVDTRSDVYSLGVLLYELLTGTTPFDKERFGKAGYVEMRRIIREEEPARPSNRISTLGPAATVTSANRKSDPRRLSRLFRGELDWVVMKALEKDRNRRYETAVAFAADVRRYLNDEPVQARPPSARYRFGKFARRNRALLGATAAVAAGVLVALTALAFSYVQLDLKQQETDRALRETDRALAAETQARTDLQNTVKLQRSDLYDYAFGLARRAWLAADIEQARQNLEKCPPELRNAEWKFLRLACHAEILRISATTKRLRYSPDGKYLAGKAAGVTVWEATEGKEHAKFLHLDDLVSMEFNRDGNELVGVDSGEALYMFNQNPQKKIDHPGFVVSVWDLKKKMRTGGFFQKGSWGRAVLNPDGSRVVLIVSNPTATWPGLSPPKSVSVHDARTGRELCKLDVPKDQAVLSVAFLADGEVMTRHGRERFFQVWDGTTGKPTRELTLVDSSTTLFAISPDGRRLASQSLAKPGTVKVWDLRTAQEIAALPGHVGAVTCLAFSRDGRRLALGADTAVIVWDVDRGTQVVALRGHTKGIYEVAFRPDGLHLASAGADNTIRVWDMRPFEELHGAGAE